MTDKKMIAVCGINCEKCDAYIATVKNDDALREKTAALWSELNGAPITKEMINCEGCRSDGIKTPFCAYMCPIKKCADEKGNETCAECLGFEKCETLSSIFKSDKSAIDNLKSLK